MDVKLIDYMGSVNRVVDSARVSFHKLAENYSDEQNLKLVNYLAKHDHWTPAAHCQVTLWQKMPVFVARQFAKHTVGFVTNEVSRRYVDDEPEFFVPDVWRSKPVNAKQGSGTEEIEWLEIDEHMIWDDPTTPKLDIGVKETYKYLMDYALDTYNLMIKNDVAPEMARMVLPQSMYTEMYTTGSLPAWARAYKLRSDSHSQKEIQDLAALWDREIKSIPELVEPWKALTT